MNQQRTSRPNQPFARRRTVVATAAWTVPAVLAVSAAPAFAASLGVSLTPYLDPEVVQANVDSVIPQVVDGLNSPEAAFLNLGTFAPYPAGSGIPQCVRVDFSKDNIYVTAQRDGTEVTSGNMTFTLSANLSFVDRAGVQVNADGTETVTVPFTEGKAFPPVFRVQGEGGGTASVTAQFEGEIAVLGPLPISPYADLCRIPDWAWDHLPA